MAAESLRIELRARPIIHERILRFLNKKSQLQLCDHIMARTLKRSLERSAVELPWGTVLSWSDSLDYALELLHSGGRMTANELKLEALFLEMQRHLTQATDADIFPREPFWSGVNRKEDPAEP